jgi:hypothetical protein
MSNSRSQTMDMGGLWEAGGSLFFVASRSQAIDGLGVIHVGRPWEAFYMVSVYRREPVLLYSDPLLQRSFSEKGLPRLPNSTNTKP